jgi:alkylation response protein AidB-like acyl-CoA dehydrogenase
MDISGKSAATEALSAAGDHLQAQDVGALDEAMSGASKKLNITNSSLVERLIYGPQPELSELTSGVIAMNSAKTKEADKILETALSLLESGQAFDADGKLSSSLRKEVSSNKAYGFTVPTEYGGLGLNYNQLAILEESLASNGIGALAVELSGQLTIGSSSLLGYGDDNQKSTFLPMIAQGRITSFALTEVGVGVNAKKIESYVEKDEENNCFRLFAQGAANKLYITSAIHSGIMAIAARVGKGGKKIGLFIIELPKEDVDNGEYEFKITEGNSDAFTSIYNSRIEFVNFPIPLENEIKADGVEVLFYCLRMGRCMLTAMCAGYQKMMAADAVNYAKQRLGVGGLIIKHELPRLGIGKMLGGALASQALSHLSLSQDSQGVDLAGLRDISKSFAASAALTSLIACERVIGGRSFDKESRITEARVNMHVFGIVEGENDLILMGMIKDITSKFTSAYMMSMLGVLQEANMIDGAPVSKEDRILKIDLKTFLKHPARCLTASAKLALKPGLYKLIGWILKSAVYEIPHLLGRLVPLSMKSRYEDIPSDLKKYVCYAERNLRKCKWLYLGISLYYQLEQTHAQVPIQRLGKKIELLVAMLALCAHASKQDRSQQSVAALQSEIMKIEIEGIQILKGLSSTETLRRHLAQVGDDAQNGLSSLIKDIKPQAFAHDWQINTNDELKKS